MAGRHTYTNDELEEYFDRICLPHTLRVHDVSRLAEQEKFDFLNVLQKHQLVKVPWENLSQHYSWHRVVNVNVKHLFNKIVRQQGRGGYCMEVNYFFHTILLSLGFDVYMAGSRIYNSSKGTFGGWTHVVNLVTIDSIRYLIDGGFGAAGPSRPIALEHGTEHSQIAPAQMRLLHQPIPQNLNQSQKVWIYQYRYSEPSSLSLSYDDYDDYDSDSDSDLEWQTCYCFTDFEFLPQDVIAMNFEPATNPRAFFTHKVVAVRFSTSRERNGPQGPGSPPQSALVDGTTSPVEIDGAVTLNHDVLKWRRRGKKVVEIPFKSEWDRVQALEMYFGITFDEQDLESINGTAAMIGSGTGVTFE